MLSATPQITAYFCGDKVASNQDRGRRFLVQHDDESDGMIGGHAFEADDILEFLEYARTLSDGGTKQARRFLFRFGIRGVYRPGPLDTASDTLSLEHVWTVVSLPNGTYYWLQSYISEYSLGEWMSKSAREGTNPMSWEEMKHRIQLIREVEKPRLHGWDQHVNRAYETLWNVNVLTSRQGRSGESFKGWRWERGQVHMDLACEWPLKAESAIPVVSQGPQSPSAV
jgi:hypothetical protein